MRLSFSKVECFGLCPYKWKLRYIDELKTLPEWDDPANPLIVGSALHHGIEQGEDAAIREYLDSFPVISDGHLEEVMKLRILIPKVRSLLSETAEFEVTLDDEGRFIGYIDYLDRENSVLLDFKYTSEKNFNSKYIKSPQVHLYKWYLKKLTGFDVKKIGYVFVPKISIRQKKTETIPIFRNRLSEELAKAEPKVVFVDYQDEKVDEFFAAAEEVKRAAEFPKNQSGFCDWCEYQDYCEKGDDYMITLPKNERRSVSGVEYKKIWVYGAPFSGKTTLADKFPDPIMINTDGNTAFVTAPVQEIRDIVESEGRLVNTTLAWDVFKDTVFELAKGSTFRTIVVDLVEDLYESCRLYMYKQMGITHESDDSYRAWDKVRTEFLSTMRKLTNLPYNIVLISHEDMSKDITKRSGDKITSIRPNINEKVANKIAGMVDIVIRCVVIDGDYRLTFKSDEVVFGGGRINPEKKEIPNNYDALIREVYGEAETAPAVPPEPITPEEVKPSPQETVDWPAAVTTAPQSQEAEPVRRKRRVRE
ncbi:MAG: AAA family ATPase [Bullifex sp.]